MNNNLSFMVHEQTLKPCGTQLFGSLDLILNSIPFHFNLVPSSMKVASVELGI